MFLDAHLKENEPEHRSATSEPHKQRLQLQFIMILASKRPQFSKKNSVKLQLHSRKSKHTVRVQLGCWRHRD